MLLGDFKIVFFSLLCGVLPTIIWLLFWLAEDKKKPEPNRLITRAFIVGGLAVIIAFYLEKLVMRGLGPLPSLTHELAPSLDTLNFIVFQIPIIFVWALIEEAVKFLVAYIALFRNRHYDEPIDAMIYMITVALGFAAIENSLFLLNTLVKGESINYFLLTSNLRFLGATVLHLVSSAVIGAALALSFASSLLRKEVYFFIGLILATLLHALFNFFIIINEGEHIFRVLMALWIGALFVIYMFERAKRVIAKPNFINTLLAQRNNLYAKR